MHAVTKGGMAMIAGLVKGQAIIRVYKQKHVCFFKSEMCIHIMFSLGER